MAYHIETFETPPEDYLAAVYTILRTYNHTANPVFWQARDRAENAPVAIHLFVANGDGDILGGLAGFTQFAWLTVDVLAVAEEFRGQGMGRSLLERAEAVARERGCRHAYLETMDYQAPGFYQKAGYAVAGHLVDWDSHGHDKYFLVKSL